MSFDGIQRYVNDEFTCISCKQVNNVRIDTLKDLYYKGKNPPIQAGHRHSSYYERLCVYCKTYNEVRWQENTSH